MSINVMIAIVLVLVACFIFLIWFRENYRMETQFGSIALNLSTFAVAVLVGLFLTLSISKRHETDRLAQADRDDKLLQSIRAIVAEEIKKDRINEASRNLSEEQRVQMISQMVGYFTPKGMAALTSEFNASKNPK